MAFLRGIGGKILLLAVVVVGCLAWWLGHQSNINSPKPPINSATSPPTSISAPKGPEKSDTPAPIQVEAKSTPTAVAKKLKTPQALGVYLKTPKLKDFVENQAEKDATYAAYYLSRQGLLSCAAFSAGPLEKLETHFTAAKATNKLAPEKLAALARVRAACDGYEQTSHDELLAIVQKQSAKFTGSDDPLAKAVRFGMEHVQQERSVNLKIFEELVRTKDALVYEELSSYLGSGRAAQVWDIGGGQTIDGQTLAAAFAAASCYFDGNCTRSQLAIDSRCILAGDLTRACAPVNILESLQQTGFSPNGYQQFLATLEWLRPGIEDDRWPVGLFNPRKIEAVKVK
jgi:hypothetical protein